MELCWCWGFCQQQGETLRAVIHGPSRAGGAAGEQQLWGAGGDPCLSAGVHRLGHEEKM